MQWCLAVFAPFVLGLLPVVVGAAEATDRGGQDPPKISFTEQIRPLLSDRCFSCHGPDEETRKGQLRLDDPDAAREAGAIYPGKPDQSLLMRRIRTKLEDEIMPPPHANLPALTEEEIELFRLWIEQGAEYEGLWSLEPVEKPPEADIDSLIEKKNQGPPLAGQADPAVLLRRLTLTLTGLPPTEADLARFTADSGDAAYEREVDRLLATEESAEHLAADWLDVARYADTHGFQVDHDRETWPWRDWVVRAFLQNLPYDKFILWQLAGDKIPEAGTDAVLATAFNRLHQQESEGGSVEEEYRIAHVNDRTVTFGTAFLGLTLECARCHDHKFDPVSQKEFYQLSAFFDDIDEAGLYSYFTGHTPTPALPLPDAATAEKEKSAAAEVSRLESELDAWRQKRGAEFEKWLASQPVISDPADDIQRHDFENSAGGEPTAQSKNPGGKPAEAVGETQILSEPGNSFVRFSGDDPLRIETPTFHRGDSFSFAFRLKTPAEYSRAVVLHRSQAASDSASKGFELLIEEGRLKWSCIHFWPGDAISIRTVEPLETGVWRHIAVTYDGSSKAAGLRIHVDGVEQECVVIRDHLTRDFGVNQPTAFGERFRDQGLKLGELDEIRAFDRQLSGAEISVISGRAVDPSSEEAQDLLRQHYFLRVDQEAAALRAGLAKARAGLFSIQDSIRQIMVMKDLPQPRQAHVLTRGEYNLKGTPVEPEVPAALPPFPEGTARDRLGLAQWLLLPEHPLTARVAVNRFWRICFGQALTKTPEDLGNQGAAPENPALLDWLAADFRTNGWNVRRLLKQMVMSKAFRRSSAATPDQWNTDPENRLFLRGPRYRLGAEATRDQALELSGLLIRKAGGPPVKPYDIAESFKPSEPSKGEGLYRRSLYTYWKRSGPSPVMEVFDMPKRDVCVARRDSTSTAAQALTLLNGTQFVEAARMLGERVWIAAGKSPEKFVDSLFTRLVCRAPDPREREILLRMFREQEEHYRGRLDEAEALLSVGEHARDAGIPAETAAAAAVVAQMVMQLDDVCSMR